MEGNEVSRTLPEDLLERILVMVPFAHIFKARVLCKSCLARLSPVSSHDDEDKKRLAVSFQKRLHEYSTKWQTFSPAFKGDNDLIAYDSASQNWRTISTLSFIPKKRVWILAMKGALLLFTTSKRDVHVANVITRSWKRLPTAPNTNMYYPGNLALLVEGDTYKVVQMFTDGGYVFGQIYDSQLGTWRCKRTCVSTNLRLSFSFDWGGSGTESLNGVFYWSVVYWSFFDLQNMPWGFLAFNVKEETFQVIPQPLLPDHYIDHKVSFQKPVVCNGGLFLAVYHTGDDYTQIASLMKLDLVSGGLLEVTRGPPNALEFDECRKQATSDGKSIFFQDFAFNNILAYDVHKDEWSYFPTPERFSEEYAMNFFSFQPGLNPFVAL